MDPYYELLRTVRDSSPLTRKQLIEITPLDDATAKSTLNIAIGRKYIGFRENLDSPGEDLINLSPGGKIYLDEYEENEFLQKELKRTTIEANKAIKRGSKVNIKFGITNLIFAVVNAVLLILYLIKLC
ncbi:MAG: hypothetical protein K9G67_04755 [Bacteroidales bacterium]|nr:hypothetical protein [Bacteroidales bacterium]MCF8344663.1 hypothetical protein [Bacteroidales bacterium]MCF8375643.1 hypothetical protein [Bacteroidales bacterium]MCF8400774.1 hypothetical protein [Bacteroidales bacterium]